MSTPKPDKTIDQLFAEFLADQEARLSPKTYSKYEAIIDRGRPERADRMILLSVRPIEFGSMISYVVRSDSTPCW